MKSKKNIVSIDPSLISTALIVSNGESFKIFNYCREKDVYGKKTMNKWFKYAEQYMTCRFIEYREFDNYSEGELTKLNDYDKISDLILDDILNNIDITIPTSIGIEGYNFGAQVGDLVDLVAFSSLLRKKLFDRVSEDINVLSPSTLKLEACKLTYKPIVKEIGGKNARTEYIWKNTFGMPGGSFTKHDMYYAIIENEKFNDDWSNLCRSLKSEITSISKMPKPFEDINDTFLLYNILK